MKKWRKKSVSMLLIVLMLVTSLGATAAPQPAEAAVSGQTIVNQGDGILRQGAVCFWRHEN